jgi:hypothetical protein
MFIELMLRQGTLRKRNKQGTITIGEMVELIGVTEILDSLDYETEAHMQGMIHELDQTIDMECQRLSHGGH